MQWVVVLHGAFGSIPISWLLPPFSPSLKHTTSSRLPVVDWYGWESTRLLSEVCLLQPFFITGNQAIHLSTYNILTNTSNQLPLSLPSSMDTNEGELLFYHIQLLINWIDCQRDMTKECLVGNTTLTNQSYYRIPIHSATLGSPQFHDISQTPLLYFLPLQPSTTSLNITHTFNAIPFQLLTIFNTLLFSAYTPANSLHRLHSTF